MSMKQFRRRRSLNELNLIDSFIFSCSTENIQDAEFISKLIIERATGHTIDKVVIESEKNLNGMKIDERGIRLDVCVSEYENDRIARVYDIEPNAYVQKELFHRSRYYQSIVDAKNLETREKFSFLPDFISIWILPYDPFGEGRMIYHVKNLVVENPKLSYNDGAERIYLYTGGTEGGTEELHKLLKLFEDTVECNATDEDLEKLFSIVNRIKQREDVGERFMMFENDLDYEKLLSREDGLAEGLAEGIITSGREFGATGEQIISMLIKKCNLSEEEAREKLEKAGNM